MSNVANTIIGRTFGSSDTAFWGRIVNPTTGVLVTQGALSSITWTVRNLGSGLTVASGTLTVSAAIFNTLQLTDAAWVQDAIGYNFKTILPGTAFAFAAVNDAAGFPQPRTFLVSFHFTTAAGQVFAQTWTVTALAVF